MIVSIIIFLVILCVLVTAHEFGHFIVARRMGINVKYFFIGFGPDIFSFKALGTTFCVKWIPLGGACVFDDDPELQLMEREKQGEEEGAEALQHSSEDEDSYGAGAKPMSDVPCDKGDDTYYEGGEDPASSDLEGSFLGASVWRRMATVVAGPMFNFLLAFLFSVFLAATTYCDRPVITDVLDGYPAMEAGMQAGDRIIKINGERIYIAREMQLIISLNQGKPMDFVYERDGKRSEVTLTPMKEPESGRLLYGFKGYIDYFRPGPLESIQYGYYELRYGVISVLKSLKLLFTGQVKPSETAGVVGMAVLVDEVRESTAPQGTWAVVVNMISLASLLSVNLGVFNLLPIPALDGGRLLLMIVEVIRGKALPPEKENFVHMAGFMFLIFIAILALFNDVLKLI